MNARIKQLRQSLGLNQTDFGARIGVTQSSVTNYENGTRVPIDAVIKSMVREFGVSEVWLRFGEGEMFQQLSRDEEIAGFIGSVIHEDSDFKQALISALSKFTESEWKALETMLDKLDEARKNS